MENMKLLLISNSTNAGEEYLKYPIANIAEHLKGVTEVLFVPYAAAWNLENMKNITTLV